MAGPADSLTRRLLEDARAGDEAAFVQLTARHRRALHHSAGITGFPRDAGLFLRLGLPTVLAGD